VTNCRLCVDLNHKLFDDSWNTCRLLEKPLTVSSNFPLRAGGDVWKEGGEDAERGKKGADVVHEVDAGVVGKLAQQCGADTAQAEGQSEEESGDCADFSGDEILSVDEDSGKGGSKDDADDDAENAGPKKAGIGQKHGERKHAENGPPNDEFAAEAVADWPADDGACGNSTEKNKKVELGALHGDMETVHEIEGVIRGQTGEIKELREHQDDENTHGERNFA